MSTKSNAQPLSSKTPSAVALTDNVKTNIGIDSAKRSKVATALSGMLATSYLLYVKTLNYHWNVTGAQFIALHQLFETHYNELNLSNDAIAERIRALGHFTPGTVKEFVSLSKISDDESLPDSAEIMVKNLLHANETCSRVAREVLKIAEEAEDEVTVDMMVHRMTAHDKAAWMLRSTIE